MSWGYRPPVAKGFGAEPPREPLAPDVAPNPPRHQEQPSPPTPGPVPDSPRPPEAPGTEPARLPTDTNELPAAPVRPTPRRVPDRQHAPIDPLVRRRPPTKTSAPRPLIGGVLVALLGVGVVAARVAGDDTQPSSVPTFVFPVDDFDAATTVPTGADFEVLTVGQSAPVGPFMVTVVSVDPRGDDEIAAANQFNTPAPLGQHFTIVTIELRNTTSEERVLFAELEVALTARDGATRYDSFNGRVLPRPLPFEAVAPSATSRGQLSFLVEDGTDPLTLEFRAFAQTDRPRTWSIT